MRLIPTSLPLVLLPLILPASAEEATAPAHEEAISPAAEEATPGSGSTSAAGSCEQRADETMGAATRVDAALRELGAEFAPAAGMADSPMPEAANGQSVVVSDGGLFFDSANSQLVYIHNVRLSDERVQLRAANRLYLQLPKQQTEDSAQKAGEEALSPSEEATQPTTPATAQQAVEEQPTQTAEQAQQQAAPPPAPVAEAPALPLEVVAYDALVDSGTNRMLFTSGPGVPKLSFQQGSNVVILTQEEGGAPARALADEAGNIMLEAPVIDLKWQEEDGSISEFHCTGGRALYHAASHSLVMEGPLEASYHNGESALSCSGPFCVTLQPEEGAAPRSKAGFMGQFTSMRFSGIAAASAAGNVQLSSRMAGGNALAVSGDALYYNGKTGEVEVPGTPCILSYGEGGCNTLQAEGSLVLEANGDIHLKGKGRIEGSYERPAREKGAAPLRGTLSATAPLSFHAATGSITTSALTAQDAEASFSCTGEVHLTLTPRTAEELAEAKLPAREKVGMVNMALARYKDIHTVKAAGQVRAQLLDPAAPTTPEASLSASQLDANLTTGEVRLTGAGETASFAFRGYALSGTADARTPASVHLKPNGDIETRGVQVSCAMPGNKGLTTLTCADRLLLARAARNLSMGPGTRIQSPDGIVTTNGSMQAVLAPSAEPAAKPLWERFPHLTYDFSGLESAETFEGATVRTAQGSLQCSQHLSILMLPPGSSERSAMGGIRSAIATGQVLLAAKDASGRVMRAAGNRLEVNGLTGEKRLTGPRVVLEDARNRHEASGEGAAVHIDARNNARITGKRHTSSATGIREQVEENDNKAQNPENKSN